MACFVRVCKNKKRLLLPESTITFHCFPTCNEMFEKWLDVLGRSNENIAWTKNRFICSDHFRPEDTLVVNGKRFLKMNALPALNLDIREENDQTLISELQKPSTSQVTDDSSCSSKRETQVLSSTIENVPEQNANKRSLADECTGSDSSTSRKIKRFKVEHNYYASPQKLRTKVEELRKKNTSQRMKLYRVNRLTRNLKRKVISLKSVVNDLKSKNMLSTFAIDHLERSCGAIPNAVLQRMLINVGSKSKSTSKYPEKLRKFAITLHFYSSRAYDYIRKTFNLSLPHPSTLRKWCSTVDCMPGFSKTCFDALKIKVRESELKNKKVICNLVLDEMSIKKQIDFDGTRNWGFVDIGQEVEGYEGQQALEALVLMVVSLNSSWKLPIAYFFINSLTGDEKANIVREALIRLAEIDILVTSVTCDGPSAHFTMFKKLGCDFRNLATLKTHFDHPSVKGEKVFAIFDACHLLKLIRNALSVKKSLVDPDKNLIQWDYIKKLHDIQDAETLLLANKLGKNHIHWQKQRMKVNIAAQTLSNSVGEAISYLSEDLKHPLFQGSEATVKFIKIVDKLFDLLNSRLPWVKGFKGPLKIENEREWRTFLEDTMDYLLNIKTPQGRFLWQTQRKTPFIGFAITIKSMIGIFDNYIKTKRMDYLLTYKLSQDHIELFFCSVRSRNGWNNNPSCLQFMRSYKKLILHADVSESGGNCRVLDSTSVLTVSSKCIGKNNLLLNDIDMNDIRRNHQSVDEYFNMLEEHNYDVLPRLVELDEYCQNVVTYMAGYVIKMLQRSLHCPECLESLLEKTPEGNNFSLMKRRNLGPYCFPSRSLVNICYESEVFIRKLMFLTDNKLPSLDLLQNIVTNVSGRLLVNLGRNIFPDHEEHNFNLMKQAINCYCKIRIHNLAKKYTTFSQGNLIRKQFNKLILFHHQ